MSNNVALDKTSPINCYTLTASSAITTPTLTADTLNTNITINTPSISATTITAATSITTTDLSAAGNITNLGNFSGNSVNVTSLTTSAFARGQVQNFHHVMKPSEFSPSITSGTCVTNFQTVNSCVINGWLVAAGGTTTFTSFVPQLSNATSQVTPNQQLASVTVYWSGNVGSTSTVNLYSNLCQASTISPALINTSGNTLSSGAGTHIKKATVNVPSTLADNSMMYINILFNAVTADTTLLGVVCSYFIN